MTTTIPEGCTVADAQMLRSANHDLAAEIDRLKEALRFYADGNHFIVTEPGAWDTVSGEPTNFQCDERGTTVEDGWVARNALEPYAAVERECAGLARQEANDQI